MRAAVVRTVVLAATVGAAAGSLVVLVGNWWVSRDAPTEFGYYSYSPLDPTSFRLGVATDWWRLLWPAALAGAIVGLAAVVMLTLRRHGVRRPLPQGRRAPVVTSFVGAALGLVVGGVLVLLAGSFGGETGMPRRYVDYLPTGAGRAYESTLTIAFDRGPSNDVVFLGVCTATGLAAGLVAGTVIALARRHRVSRRTAGAA